MKFERCEIETTINYDDSTKYADIFTRNKKNIEKLLDLAKRFPDDYQVVDLDYEFRCLKKYIGFRTPTKMSEEQRQKSKERLEKARAKRKANQTMAENN